jgi:acyl phosphate:glycerol-3-phosphate acyltransferase
MIYDPALWRPKPAHDPAPLEISVNAQLLLTVLLPLAAYFVGAIPCGLLLARRFTRLDLRREGSGNIGATNVARVAGPALGLATLAADMLKALVPVWATSAWTASPEASVAAAVAAVLGHTFPVYSRFRGGGKGVATTAGGFLWIAPTAVLLATAAFIVYCGILRRASVGSLAAALMLPFAVQVATGSWTATAGAALASSLIFIRHAENIRRLAAGTEPVFRFGRGR